MEDDQDMLQYYMSIGAVEVVGITDDGEFIFGITDSAKDNAPELWEAHVEYIDKSMVDLYDKGLIEVSYNEDLEAFIQLTEEGKAEARRLGIVEMEDPNK